ncbi:rRNA adenine N-6-methyltransferase family protein, partial [Actinoplanes sp. NPDC051851]|uniref:rRNA adenine N-6-methyltransferase family protein n=1 Tax=Actinoplanes sp. NPDC051851 TaxID=3154753 RepID=UPI003443133B
MRTLLAGDHWHTAVLLVQWEVARRRAGLGGATLMTASWWPWYEFGVHSRVPARAFRPVPAVDGGLLTMARRPVSGVADRPGYQAFVRRVFTGRGHGLRDILLRAGRVTRTELHQWMRSHGLSPMLLPQDLTAAQWISLWPRDGTGLGIGGRRGLERHGADGADHGDHAGRD